MRSVTEMLLLKWGGVLYIVLVAPPPPLADMRLADAIIVSYFSFRFIDAYK